MGSAQARASRLDLEGPARVQLERSRARHQLAMARLQKAISDQQRGVQSSRDGEIAVQRALADERAARSEFMKALQVFSDLVIHGIEPGPG